MKKVFIIFLTLLSVCAIQAQEELVIKGDSAYKREAYLEAVEYYQEVLDMGYESAALYYNLGNAYFNLNNLPEAILNYERAKVLAPRDKDIAFNLNIANSMIPDKIEVVPEIFYVRWWKSLRNSINLQSWAVASLLVFALIVLSAGIYSLSRNLLMRKLAFWTGGVLIVLGICIFAMTYTKYDMQSQHMEAIVFDPTITVKSSPNQLGKDLFVIHEGTKVFIMEEINSWCNIRIANGSEGWLPAGSIKRI